MYFVSEAAQVELKVDECKPLVPGRLSTHDGVGHLPSAREVGRCTLTL